jgi:para-nitrobenzyl esterase
MNRKSWLYYLVALCGMTVVVPSSIAMTPSEVSAGSSPIVKTQQGMLRGAWQADGSAVFKAIPYAAAPVGALRWKAPQSPLPWNGVRDATGTPPACMQVDWKWNSSDARSDSEDCLYLNIVTPSLHPVQSMSVIFWIHGGGNYNGSGRSFENQTLTRHGVVLVNINYRLGVFGFLAHPQLTQESGKHTSGNYAIQDQIAALRWVHDNIIHFGGDPNNVTIAGQSAGAMNVGILLMTPASKGLFVRAIAESGGPINPEPMLPSLSRAESIGEKLAGSVGVAAGPGQLAALRKIPAAQLLDVVRHFTAQDSEGVPTREGPNLIVDGVVVPEQPTSAVHDGTIHPVPLLIGSNIQEFSFGRSSLIRGNSVEPADEIRARIHQSFGEEATAAIAFYGLDKFDHPAPDPLLGSVGTQLMTDVYFRCPATITTQWLADRGKTVWQYDFERPLPGTEAISANHSGELPYVFGWAQLIGNRTVKFFGASFGPQDALLSEQMQTYWVNFARNGDPNGRGLPSWPQAGGTTPQLMRFTSGGGAIAGQDLRLKLCNVYAQHLVKALKTYK